MRITPVTRSLMSNQRDESNEGKRQRLFALIKELSYTDPRMAKINREIIAQGGIDSKICNKILSELLDKRDRRSQRVVQIVTRILGCSDVVD